MKVHLRYSGLRYGGLLFLLLISLGSGVGVVGSVNAQSADHMLTEVPSDSGNTLALVWSGDGGWRELTDDLTKEWSRRGIASLGVNSRQWLTSKTRTPDSLVAYSTELIREYMARWHRSRILLVGYSRGAGFMAILATTLPPDLREKTAGVVLLGLDHSASFEFHLIDLVKTVKRPTDIAIRPFLDRLSWAPGVCVYGSDENDSVCPELDPAVYSIIERSGGHHFDRDYTQLADDILAALDARRKR